LYYNRVGCTYSERIMAKAVKYASYAEIQADAAGAAVAVKILMETAKNTPSIAKGICGQT
jgi:hypothetical protein